HEGDTGAIAAGRDAIADGQGDTVQQQDAVGRQGLDHEAGDGAVRIGTAEADRDTGGVFVAGTAGRIRVRRVVDRGDGDGAGGRGTVDRKSTRLNSSHVKISYAVFCLKKKKVI